MYFIKIRNYRVIINADDELRKVGVKLHKITDIPTCLSVIFFIPKISAY